MLNACSKLSFFKSNTSVQFSKHHLTRNIFRNDEKHAYLVVDIIDQWLRSAVLFQE